MKVFVTGATGFIGKPLTIRLAEQGHLVHALYRSISKTRKLDHKNITLFMGTLNDRDSIKKAIAGCEQVYHVAAFARAWSRDPEQYVRQNTEGTKNVLDCSLRAGVKRVVFVSTAGVFGPSENNRIIDEQTPYPDKYPTLYDLSKRMAEELALGYNTKGLSVMVVNPTRVYGPGPLTGSNGIARIIHSYIRGKWYFMPGNGKSTGNYVYIDDVIDGLIKAIQQGTPGSRYLLGGSDASFKELMAEIAKQSGRRSRLFRIPFPLLILISRMIVLWSRISGTEPLIAPDFLNKFRQDYRVSSGLARKELDYQPVPLEEGIRKTIEWLRKTQ
jgi:nucleoside-diphosphate-sugar epimerase